jgi:hypothetical protein
MRLGIWDPESETLELAVGLSLEFTGEHSHSHYKESSISDGGRRSHSRHCPCWVPVLSPTRQPGPRD